MDERRRTHTDGAKSTFYFGLEDSSGRELLTQPPFDAGDAQILVDSGDDTEQWVPTSNLPVWKGFGLAKIKLTTAEMSGQIAVLRIADQTDPPAWRVVKFPFHTGGDQFALLDGT